MYYFHHVTTRRCTELREGDQAREDGRRRGAERRAAYETMALEQPSLLKVSRPCKGSQPWLHGGAASVA